MTSASIRLNTWQACYQKARLNTRLGVYKFGVI
jgi:hypothetical protein